MPAFVIPPLSGATPYAAVEDVESLSRWVDSGGLVVVHDSLRLSEGTEELITQVLGYAGDWKQHCQAVGGSPGGAVPSAQACSFLPGPWPERLEGGLYVQSHTWCSHGDPEAVAYPLYVVEGDQEVVAQAFGRVGSRGAVVWLGFSWKGSEEAREPWARLLAKLIQDFADGLHQPPAQPSCTGERLPMDPDSAADDLESLAEDTAELLRHLVHSEARSTIRASVSTRPQAVGPMAPLR
ncbi:hypothetical protein GPECTOR_7g925 [Gonium pectorale]|uniref:Uncharacterized protein n=1 Tax=Gonium pectorale TaxID=33097 RepID=A0A150GUD7_GONPE|nr:hypothetical protein GPECTOR_7g925 [Gonium pectorale]|eukprot:KXZ53475.1 hypothetical protein GPECTOR_7g925 [Gonium pectorale]